MCGIAGIWEFDGRPIREDTLDRFTDALRHRGPDGRGTFVDAAANLGLGHRRLAILDPSETGAQPMAYADGRYWITYNGEIYNFLELERELRAHGHAFRSCSDTEVILAAYDRWGAECQLRFNGMWAFAIWDRERRELFLSRDRFGVKPLHYLLDPGRRFAFASEIKAFKRLDGFGARISDDALRAVLTNPFQIEASTETLLESVKRLPAGHQAVVRATGMEISRWWSTLDHLVSVPRNFGAQVDRFRELFDDACRLRMRSDVPIGTALSGGLDSTSVACTVAKLGARTDSPRASKDWQRATTASFVGTSLDERAYADLALRHAGLRGHVVEVEPAFALANLDRILADFEDVYITLPDGPWATYRAMREQGLTVSIDGHGADELLGGYDDSCIAALRDSAAWWGPTLRTLSLIETYCAVYGAAFASSRLSRTRLLALALHEQPAWRPLLRVAGTTTRAWQSVRHRSGQAAPPSEEWVRRPRRIESPETAREAEWMRDACPLDADLYRSFHFTILPTILRTFDRLSMAHGVEIRMPFLDWRLVAYAFSLPPEAKIGGGYTKRVLREAMRERIPRAIRTRRAKIGFNSPMTEWFRGPLREMLRGTVRDPAFLTSTIWNGPAIASAVDRHLATGGWTWNEALRVWTFVHAHWYVQRFCAS